MPESIDIGIPPGGIIPSGPLKPLITDNNQPPLRLPTGGPVPPQARNIAPPNSARQTKGRSFIDANRDETGVELPSVAMVLPPDRSSEAMGSIPVEMQATMNGTRFRNRGAGLPSSLPPVQITIDRIEVQAAPAFEPAPLPSAPVNIGPALSLEDYLQQRDEGSA